MLNEEEEKKGYNCVDREREGETDPVIAFEANRDELVAIVGSGDHASTRRHLAPSSPEENGSEFRAT